MYSKNQLIKIVNQLNVLINVQQLHVESKTSIFFSSRKQTNLLFTCGILHESSVFEYLISASSLYNLTSDLNEFFFVI